MITLPLPTPRAIFRGDLQIVGPSSGIGPFTNGTDLYVVTDDLAVSSDSRAAIVFKSTDGGLTWVKTDVANGPTVCDGHCNVTHFGAGGGFDTIRDVDPARHDFWVTSINFSSGACKISLKVFHMDTDTWGVEYLSNPNTTPDSDPNSGVVVAPNGVSPAGPFEGTAKNVPIKFCMTPGRKFRFVYCGELFEKGVIPLIDGNTTGYAYSFQPWYLTEFDGVSGWSTPIIVAGGANLSDTTLFGEPLFIGIAAGVLTGQTEFRWACTGVANDGIGRTYAFFTRRLIVGTGAATAATAYGLYYRVIQDSTNSVSAFNLVDSGIAMGLIGSAGSYSFGSKPIVRIVGGQTEIALTYGKQITPSATQNSQTNVLAYSARGNAGNTVAWTLERINTTFENGPIAADTALANTIALAALPGVLYALWSSVDNTPDASPKYRYYISQNTGSGWDAELLAFTNANAAFAIFNHLFMGPTTDGLGIIAEGDLRVPSTSSVYYFAVQAPPEEQPPPPAPPAPCSGPPLYQLRPCRIADLDARDIYWQQTAPVPPAVTGPTPSHGVDPPSYYFTLGLNLMGLWQNPTEDLPGEVTYAYEPPLLVNDTDSPLVPEEYHETLCKFAAVWIRLTEGSTEFAKVGPLLTEFLADAQKLASYVRLRSLASKYDSLPSEITNAEMARMVKEILPTRKRTDPNVDKPAAG